MFVFDVSRKKSKWSSVQFEYTRHEFRDICSDTLQLRIRRGIVTLSAVLQNISLHVYTREVSLNFDPN